MKKISMTSTLSALVVGAASITAPMTTSAWSYYSPTPACDADINEVVVDRYAPDNTITVYGTCMQNVDVMTLGGPCTGGEPLDIISQSDTMIVGEADGDLAARDTKLRLCETYSTGEWTSAVWDLTIPEVGGIYTVMTDDLCDDLTYLFNIPGYPFVGPFTAIATLEKTVACTEGDTAIAANWHFAQPINIIPDPTNVLWSSRDAAEQHKWNFKLEVLATWLLNCSDITMGVQCARHAIAPVLTEAEAASQ